MIKSLNFIMVFSGVFFGSNLFANNKGVDVLVLQKGEVLRASSSYRSSVNSIFDCDESTKWQASYSGWSSVERVFSVPVKLSGLTIKTENVSKISVETACNFGLNYKEVVPAFELSDSDVTLSFETNDVAAIKINVHGNWPSISECMIFSKDAQRHPNIKRAEMRQRGDVFVALLYPADMHWWSWISQADLEKTLETLSYSYRIFTNINDIADHIDDFDIIILHTRYETPEDSTQRQRLASAFRNWVNDGGVLISFDADQGTRFEWFNSWGDDFELYAAGSNFPMLSRLPANLKKPLSPIVSYPHTLPAPMVTTSHFTRYNMWDSVAFDFYDHPIMIQKNVGDGMVLVLCEDEYESFWQNECGLMAKFIENCRAAVVKNKYGMQIEKFEFPISAAPSKIFNGVFRFYAENKNNLEFVLSDLQGNCLYKSDLVGQNCQLSIPIKDSWYSNSGMAAVIVDKLANQVIFKSLKIYNEIAEKGFEISIIEPSYRKEVFLDDIGTITVKINSNPCLWGKKLNLEIFNDKSKIVLIKTKFIIDKAEMFKVINCNPLISGHYVLKSWVEENDDLVRIENFRVYSKQESSKVVYLNRNNNLVVYGKPVFPLGLYRVPKDKLCLVAEKGFNVVVPTNEQGYGDRDYIKAAYDCNLMVIPELNGVLDKVPAFKEHPAVIAWYVADEPGARKEAVERTIEDYHQIQKMDATRPILLVDNMLSRHCLGSDIVAQDIYPSSIIGANRGKILPLELIGSKLRRQVSAEESKFKAMWFVPQAFGGWGDYAAAPTPKQIRATAYGAIAHNVKGLIWYAYWTPEVADWMIDEKFPDLWRELCAVVGELKELTPILLSNQRPDKATIDPILPDIPFRQFRYNNTNYILIVNWQPYHITKSITLDTKATYAEEVLTGEKFHINKNKIVVDMAPLDVYFLKL